MIVLGLIGPIGAGKTYVLELFGRCGAVTIKADDVSRQLQQPGTALLHRLRQEFGDSYFDEKGALLRGKLAGLIFTDENARKRLNAIMYPAMVSALQAQLERFDTSDTPPDVVVIEAANLFEMGADALVDCILSVTAPTDMRIQRLCDRDGISPIEAKKRIESQAAAGLESSKADFEITTDVGEGALIEIVECIYRSLSKSVC